MLELPRSAFEWLMKQKGDIKAQIEQQASSYAGAGSFDVETSATPKGNAALNEEQLRELTDSQALELLMSRSARRAYAFLAAQWILWQRNGSQN